MASIDGLVVFVLALLCCSFTLSWSASVSHDERAIVINGERKLIISGSIHYPRSTPKMWPDLIRKAKEGGLNAIETYVFWNAHEPRRREYNFKGRLNLIRFLQTIQAEGLYAVLRIGPYVCAEWNYGGFPVWLRQLPGIQMRTDNNIFENEMQNFTTLIVDMIKQAGLLAPQGGPIIVAQIENEYGNIDGPYGDAGKRYIQWCANLAESFNAGVPWVMCQQNDAPQPMINTCNGFYCDNFTPNNAKSPKMWTENWTGWFKSWGGYHPIRPVEDIAFSVARFFQRQGTFQNYYMYHGGTNFGRSTGGPYITTSYDYDAPLDEYGNLRQPKWGHLKELHEALQSMDQALLYGDVQHTNHGNGVWSSIYSGQDIAPGCLLCNTNNKMDYTLSFNGLNYTLPAWSVSVLPDCMTEAHNTAKIRTQTSVMVAVQNQAEKEPDQLDWSWRPEIIKNTLHGRGASFSTNQLLEQLSTTLDVSDYLWYMTSVYLDPKGPNFTQFMTLRVNTTGHGLYAFVNEHFIGSQYATGTGSTFSFVFEGRARVKPGMNHITLLSSTVGLQTNFNAPLGDEPVVVDLKGMGKGHAWVNGHSIGRYWPNFTASSDGCNPCDYRGSFSSNKCNTGCGEPTQRRYHVPRSFLNDETNTLVLFEEFGGDPLQVWFETVMVGTICADLEEGNTMTLACQAGHTISSVTFASYGDAQGSCGNFTTGSCEASGVFDLVQQDHNMPLVLARLFLSCSRAGQE
ncbi:Beta-galactosidase 15 [Acorus calamus]|uniref:Beta-galactosidase n=1 Tax=Acorus calamus TaxID=4465 RepID=A0AAV9E6F6_ACOCL|nr:Beta-galactosidase 15 [Acorus calamus]